MNTNNQIDFSYFIDQELIDIKINENTLLILILCRGQLSVECPWRLRNKKEILIGEVDCISAPEKYSPSKLKQILANKEIKNITFTKELFLLSIEFEDKLFFDLFHNSNYFEEWVLQGDEIDELFSFPGGDVSY
ncbi:hypothetical protein [Bacillus sp. ISL-41]|uniref:hypothetical protein n=1 Tax=Bacillus sp. ISL-41 TaxID=2819127 RepID=UPI0020356E13|nr:hypothetical protein [Bacillus sp. ISL-41]